MCTNTYQKNNIPDLKPLIYAIEAIAKVINKGDIIFLGLPCIQVLPRIFVLN